MVGVLAAWLPLCTLTLCVSHLLSSLPPAEFSPWIHVLLSCNQSTKANWLQKASKCSSHSVLSLQQSPRGENLNKIHLFCLVPTARERQEHSASTLCASGITLLQGRCCFHCPQMGTPTCRKQGGLGCICCHAAFLFPSPPAPRR